MPAAPAARTGGGDAPHCAGSDVAAGLASRRRRRWPRWPRRIATPARQAWVVAANPLAVEAGVEILAQGRQGH